MTGSSITLVKNGGMMPAQTTKVWAVLFVITVKVKKQLKTIKQQL